MGCVSRPGWNDLLSVKDEGKYRLKALTALK